MYLSALFGRTITNIYAVYGTEQGWLETADCFLQLDNNDVIGFPFFYDDEIWFRELPGDAELLFKNIDSPPVINRKIKDFIWFDNEDYGGYFLLDDGSLVGETRMSPHGTGQAGLNFYTSLAELTVDKEMEMKRLSETKI